MVAAPLACDVPITSTASDGPSVLDTSPAGGDEGVLRLGPFVAFFDRQLLPRTVNRGTVRVRSGDVDHFLSVRFDPVERALIAIPVGDRPLEPNVVYRFVIDGVRDLDDQQIATEHVVRFRTGDEVGTPEVPPAAGWADVAPIFETRCATAAGCHTPENPPFGLDLSSAEAVARTAIGRRSPRLGGTTGPDANRGSIFFGALHIIDVIGGVGRPDGSLLIYKVLGDEHVLGERMPPPDEGAALSHDEIQTLSAWILAGAPTS
ncbi:MAG: hypothetical protein DRJ42_26600 [Deltaproteobacteria bacterium]|nr:MAG: hypothetical protein DRJ42_26600 [Deltaproteobacteria bacterium]